MIKKIIYLQILIHVVISIASYGRVNYISAGRRVGVPVRPIVGLLVTVSTNRLYSTFNNSNECAGGFYEDITAFDNHGTQSTAGLRPAVVPEGFGFALDFDGNNDSVNHLSPTALNDVAPVSITAWIKLDGWGEGNLGRIVAKRIGGGAGKGWVLFVVTNVANYNNGSLAFFRATDAGGGNIHGRWSSPANSITLGTWIHVGLVYTNNTTNDIPIMYLNGSQVSVTVGTKIFGTISSDAAENLNIGSEAGAFTFNGQIDEFKLYQGVLSASDMTAIFNEDPHPQGFPTPLVYYNHSATTATATVDVRGLNDATNYPDTDTGPRLDGVGTNQHYFMDGANDAHNVGNQSVLNFTKTDSFSMAGWFRIYDTGAGSLAGRQDSSGGFDGYLWHVGPSNQKMKFTLNDDAGNDITVATSIPLIGGEYAGWYHLAVTIDGTGTDEGIIFYTNGVVATHGVDNDSLSGTMAGTRSFDIGARGGDGNYPHGFLYDDFMMWDEVITGTHLTNIMNAFPVPVEF